MTTAAEPARRRAQQRRHVLVPGLASRLAHDSDVLRLPAGPPPEEPVTEAELAGLPGPAQR